jgi:hypothetical protein
MGEGAINHRSKPAKKGNLKCMEKASLEIRRRERRVE